MSKVLLKSKFLKLVITEIANGMILPPTTNYIVILGVIGTLLLRKSNLLLNPLNFLEVALLDESLKYSVSQITETASVIVLLNGCIFSFRLN